MKGGLRFTAVVTVVVLSGFFTAAGATAQPTLAAEDSACGPELKLNDELPTLQMLQQDRAREVTMGLGVKVAVVDSGVDINNPHLVEAVDSANSMDFVNDGQGNGGIADANGHGTAVAGIIAARAIDGSSVVGLAPKVEIISIRVHNGQPEQDTQDTDSQGGNLLQRLIQGIRAAADAGAQVINVSASTPNDDSGLKSAVEYAYSKGALVVASAGNRGQAEDKTDSPRYPAAYDHVVSVAAVDSFGMPTDNAIHGPHVDIAAPGANVITANTNGIDCVFASDAPSTSFATAYVSAAAALLVARYANEGPDGWKYRLEATAVRPNPDERDDLIGWGVVQPYDALMFIPGDGVRGPLAPHASSAAPLVAAEGQDLTLGVSVSPWKISRSLAALIAVLAAMSLGILGPLLFLRRVKSEADPGELRSAGGLFPGSK